MAKIEQFKCDGCGKLKGETNHWWSVTFGGSDQAITITRFGVGEEEGSERVPKCWADFCGQKCALEFISAQMAGGKG